MIRAVSIVIQRCIWKELNTLLHFSSTEFRFSTHVTKGSEQQNSSSIIFLRTKYMIETQIFRIFGSGKVSEMMHLEILSAFFDHLNKRLKTFSRNKKMTTGI